MAAEKMDLKKSILFIYIVCYASFCKGMVLEKLNEPDKDPQMPVQILDESGKAKLKLSLFFLTVEKPTYLHNKLQLHDRFFKHVTAYTRLHLTKYEHVSVENSEILYCNALTFLDNIS